jgi:hypothetical protein
MNSLLLNGSGRERLRYSRDSSSTHHFQQEDDTLLLHACLCVYDFILCMYYHIILALSTLRRKKTSTSTVNSWYIIRVKYKRLWIHFLHYQQCYLLWTSFPQRPTVSNAMKIKWLNLRGARSRNLLRECSRKQRMMVIWSPLSILAVIVLLIQYL